MYHLFPKKFVIILLKSKKYCVILKTKGVIYLPDKELGQCLKKAREDAGISVEEISNILTSMGFKAGRNTIYNWEGGISQPTPDALLHMCRIYNIKDILSFFGYKKSAPTEAEARIEDLINSQRGQALLSKYSVLTEPAQGRVDATVNDIWSNPVNRIDQQPQEPSTNARTIEYAAWGVGPTTSTVNVDEETLRAAEEDRLRRQADRLMAERDRAAAAKKGFGRKRKK